ncbi:hypothetical protein Goarm_014799, partial [Gossypium armourianum]|nr:hypothetical protein [Gossypium armourianum]
EKRIEIDENERLSSYQYVGRTGSVIPTASLPGTDVSIEEIRSATSFSTPYPPSIHAPLISSPEALPNEQAIPHQSPYATDYGTYSNDFQRDKRVAHRSYRSSMLLGSRPARTWKIHAVEDCNV